jgi:hypothetical protein
MGLPVTFVKKNELPETTHGASQSFLRAGCSAPAYAAVDQSPQ